MTSRVSSSRPRQQKLGHFPWLPLVVAEMLGTSGAPLLYKVHLFYKALNRYPKIDLIR